MGLKEADLSRREAQLEEWKAEIMKLNAKAEQAQAQVQIVYYEQIAALRVPQTTVRHKLAEMRQAPVRHGNRSKSALIPYGRT